MDSINSKQNSQRYNGLDGLRAFCALGIAMMHYRAFIIIKPSENFFMEQCIPFFTEFVFLFFMISAFGLCCGYYDKIKNKTSELDINSFYKRRITKIWPYFALLVLIDVFVFILQNGFVWNHHFKGELAEAFADLTLCFNLLPNPDIQVIGAGWFIGTIFLFYMIFPFYCFLLNNKRRAWTAMGVAIIMHILVVRYFLTEEFVLPKEIANARHNIIYSFPFLIAGGLVYLYKEQLECLLKKNARRYILLLIILFLTILQVVSQPEILGENRLYLLILFFLWLTYGLTEGIRLPFWGGGKLLDNPVMKFLGDISMEIYLTHMLFFRLIEKLHLENSIHNQDFLFIITYLIGIIMTILFAYVVKNYLFVYLKTLAKK